MNDWWAEVPAARALPAARRVAERCSARRAGRASGALAGRSAARAGSRRARARVGDRCGVRVLRRGRGDRSQPGPVPHHRRSRTRGRLRRNGCGARGAARARGGRPGRADRGGGRSSAPISGGRASCGSARRTPQGPTGAGRGSTAVDRVPHRGRDRGGLPDRAGRVRKPRAAWARPVTARDVPSAPGPVTRSGAVAGRGEVDRRRLVVHRSHLRCSRTGSASRSRFVPLKCALLQPRVRPGGADLVVAVARQAGDAVAVAVAAARVRALDGVRPAAEATCARTRSRSRSPTSVSSRSASRCAGVELLLVDGPGVRPGAGRARRSPRRSPRRTSRSNAVPARGAVGAVSSSDRGHHAVRSGRRSSARSRRASARAGRGQPAIQRRAQQATT